MNVHWYPGHMKKALRETEKRLALIDIVIEVVDARAPHFTKNSDFDELFSKKLRIILLNKTDMAVEKLTQNWCEQLSKTYPTMAYCAASPDRGRLFSLIEKVSAPLVAKYKERGMNKTVRILIAGVPNVGKSAIINSLAGTNRVAVANKPGVTRGLSWVRLSPYLELMDSPGMLPPKIESDEAGAVIAAVGCIKTEVLDTDEIAFFLLKKLLNEYPNNIMKRYNIEQLECEPWDVIAQICKRRGMILKGGEPDFERGAAMFLDELKNGKLGRITYELPTMNANE